jgi:hypothetical protein
MKTIRKFAFATLLAMTTLNFAPTLASAQEPAHGKFTLTHEVHWGSAKLPAGQYMFSFDPDAGFRVLSLNKLSGIGASYMVLVRVVDEAKPKDMSRLVLEATPGGSYVSAMQLPEFGMTLYFPVPSHATGKQIARADTATLVARQ